MRRALLLFAALLTGCAGPQIKVIYHDTYAETTEAYGDVYHFKGRTVGGFIEWRGNTCYVHMSLEAPDLDRCYKHERDHCWFGAWHGDEWTHDC